MQEYAQVSRMLGDKMILVIIPGRFMLVKGGRRYYREFEQVSMANTVDEDKESMDFPKQKLDSYADNLYIKIYK